MTDEEYLKARGWWQTDDANDLWRRTEIVAALIGPASWHSPQTSNTVTVYTREAALKKQLAEDKKNLAGVLEYVRAH